MVGTVKNSMFHHLRVNHPMVRKNEFNLIENDSFGFFNRVILGPPRLMFVLRITFEDSQELAIYSDQTWKGRQGSIVHDSVYNGEIVDNRYDRPNWAQVGFNDTLSLWITPEIMPPPVNVTANGQMTLQDMPPIRAGVDALQFEIDNPSEIINSYLTKEDIGDIQGGQLHDGGVLKPVSVSTPVLGVHTFDMGQNMVGWCRFHFHGPRGLGIYIRHAEVLAQPVIASKYDRLKLIKLYFRV